MASYFNRHIYIFCPESPDEDPGLSGMIGLKSLVPRGLASLDLAVPVTIQHILADGSLAPVNLSMRPNPVIMEKLHFIMEQIYKYTVSVPIVAPMFPPAEA